MSIFGNLPQPKTSTARTFDVAATELLQQLAARGVHLTAIGDRLRAAPATLLTDELRAAIRVHKVELLNALESDTPPDPAAEARRQRVLEMLAERPEIRYAAVTDYQADRDAVILALAIRGLGTCELRIPREKYDGVLLLDLIERHGGTVH